MIPDLFEAITAYRAFDVHPNGLLVGQAHAEPWPPYQPFVARCGAVSGQGFRMHLENGVFVSAPVLACDCGIHALKTLDAAKLRAAGDDGLSYNFSRIDRRAWGEVKLWGRVIEHTHGWRAEFAYPARLKCEDAALAKIIAHLYGIPCDVETIARPEVEGLSGLISSHGMSIGRATFAFWRNQQLFSPPTYLGVLTSISDDAVDTPMVQLAPVRGVVAPPAIVAASRWQRRQYAKQLLPCDLHQVDWRQILRDGLYASALNPDVRA